MIKPTVTDLHYASLSRERTSVPIECILVRATHAVPAHLQMRNSLHQHIFQLYVGLLQVGDPGYQHAGDVWWQGVLLRRSSRQPLVSGWGPLKAAVVCLLFGGGVLENHLLHVPKACDTSRGMTNHQRVSSGEGKYDKTMCHLGW